MQCDTRIAFLTLGCKLNFAESSFILHQLGAGFKAVSFKSEADIYVVHSCVVTAAAEKKCRSYIRQAHRRNPDAKVVVIGCMSELRTQELASMPEVNMVIGNADKHSLKQYLSNNKKKAPILKRSDINTYDHFEFAYSFEDRTRMFVKVQDGCDYYCSYCAVPYARGRSRSDTLAETVANIKKAISINRPKEIVLTGVNIGDFGRNHQKSFLELIRELENLDVDRIRLSSIEPDLLADETIHFASQSNRIMPHFHIPLQSGSDRVLERMNRRYVTDLFSKKVLLIKSLIPHACIAVDVIAGFPGETENDFETTCNLLQNLPLSYLHVFPYSDRPGTRAYLYTDKINPIIKQNRTAQLLSISDTKHQQFLTDNTGRTESVLFESTNRQGRIEGFTKNYIRVYAPFDARLVNQIIEVKLEMKLREGFLTNSLATNH